MVTTSVHVSQHVRCSAEVAYAFARDPANLPKWAAGLPEDVLIDFVPVNEHGVLDHTVVLPDGTRVYNPVRVIPDGEACEVVFTLRRRPTMTDGEFDEDAAAVAQDLLTLKRVLESAPAS